jgi:hypothetical protein
LQLLAYFSDLIPFLIDGCGMKLLDQLMYQVFSGQVGERLALQKASLKGCWVRFVCATFFKTVFVLLFFPGWTRCLVAKLGTSWQFMRFQASTVSYIGWFLSNW